MGMQLSLLLDLEVAKGMVGDKYLHSMEGIGKDEIWSMFDDAV